MASTSIFRLSSRGPPLRAFEGDDLSAAVVTTVRADAVRNLGLPALRAGGACRRAELPVRAALAAARLRVAAFRQGHEMTLPRSVVETRRQPLQNGQPRIRSPRPPRPRHH